MAQKIIVVLTHTSWDFPCDYVRQISLELAQKAKVIVCYPLGFPTLRNLLLNSQKRKEWLALFREKSVYYFPSVGVFPLQRIRAVERLNIWLNLIFFRFWYYLKFGLQKPIFWVFSYEFVEILPFLRWGKLLVYDRADQNASLDSQQDYEIKQKEQQFLRKADYVFVNSPYALRYVKKYNQKAFLVPWGCTAGFLKNLKRMNLPKEIKRIKKPRIGLIGHFDHRTNINLLFDLARKRKNWNFVLIGPVIDFDVKQAARVKFDWWIRTAKKLSNVIFLGEKPKAKMPNYIAGLDICLILYDTTQEFVEGCNPMKLYDYLALGKPVVSTPIEAIKQYSPVVKIANSVLGFEKNIEDFLREENSERERRLRKKIALANTWKKRIDLAWGILQKEEK